MKKYSDPELEVIMFDMADDVNFGNNSSNGDNFNGGKNNFIEDPEEDW